MDVISAAEASAVVTTVYRETAASAEPTVVLLTGPPGVGKTWVVQQLYEALRASETSCWPPLAAPTATALLVEADSESMRKQIVPRALEPSRDLRYLWLGVNCAERSWNRIDVIPAAFEAQMTRMVQALEPTEQDALRERRLRLTMSLLGGLASAVNPLASFASSTITVVGAVRGLLDATGDLALTEEVEDAFASAFEADLELLSAEEAGRRPTCLIVDDAHLAPPSLLRAVAAAVRQVPLGDDRSYLTAGDPGLSGFPCLLLLNGWDSSMGSLGRLVEELHDTDMRTIELRIGGMAPEDARRMAADLLGELELDTSGAPDIAGLPDDDDELRNPLLVQERLRASVAPLRAEVPVPSFVDQLPSSLDQIYADRLREIERDHAGASAWLTTAAAVALTIPLGLVELIASSDPVPVVAAGERAALLNVDPERSEVTFDELLQQHARSIEWAVELAGRAAHTFFERSANALLDEEITETAKIGRVVQSITLVADAVLRSPDGRPDVRALAGALVQDWDAAVRSCNLAIEVGETALVPFVANRMTLRVRRAIDLARVAELIFRDGTTIGELLLATALPPRVVAAHPGALAALGRAADGGDVSAADNLARAILASALRTSSPPDFTGLLLGWLAAKNPSVTIRLARRFPREEWILEEGAQDSSVRHLLATRLRDRGDPSAAERLLADDAAEVEDCALLRADCLVDLGRPDDALELLTPFTHLSEAAACAAARLLASLHPPRKAESETILRWWVDPAADVVYEQALTQLVTMLEQDGRQAETLDLLESNAPRSRAAAIALARRRVAEAADEDLSPEVAGSALAALTPFVDVDHMFAVEAAKVLLAQRPPDRGRAEEILRRWVGTAKAVNNEHALKALVELLDDDGRSAEASALLGDGARHSANAAIDLAKRRVRGFAGRQPTPDEVRLVLDPLLPWLDSSAMAAVEAGLLLERYPAAFADAETEEVLAGLAHSAATSPQAACGLGVLLKADEPVESRRLLEDAAERRSGRAILHLAFDELVAGRPEAALRQLERGRWDTRVRFRQLLLLVTFAPAQAVQHLRGWLGNDPEALAQHVVSTIDEHYAPERGLDLIAFLSAGIGPAARRAMSDAFRTRSAVTGDRDDRRREWCEGTISIPRAVELTVRVGWDVPVGPLDRDALLDAVRTGWIPPGLDSFLLGTARTVLGVRSLTTGQRALLRSSLHDEVRRLATDAPSD